MTKQPKLSYKTGKLYDKTQIICHTVWETVIQNLSYRIGKLCDKSETVRQNTKTVPQNTNCMTKPKLYDKPAQTVIQNKQTV